MIVNREQGEIMPKMFDFEHLKCRHGDTRKSLPQNSRKLR
jgi:hypothetical protein